MATMTDVDFDVVSPIAGSDVTASGTLTVTCYRTLGTNPLLLPEVNVCVNLGVGPSGGTGSTRCLLNGSNGLPTISILTVRTRGHESTSRPEMFEMVNFDETLAYVA